ncbi:MAG: FAD-dependent oxidoreductase [Sedimentitalea sp.]|uniref:flavin monoamine oxidase family protein n=1 Tax=Sedimentitalea sp. TaxID=2048915 RepID=UPI0032651831
MHTDTLIIGGGLAGLSLASRLTDLGQSFLLAEARDRLGGRISAVRHEGATYDMGPAWFWPGQQRIAKLISDLGLRRFAQYSRGDLMFENTQGQTQRGQGFSSMQGSYRLEGGLIRLIECLSESVPASHLRLSCAITALTKQGDTVTAQLHGGRTITAGRAVLALPPRLAAQITYAPALPNTSMEAMHQTATWMAGHAKAVAIYDRPFWREVGLSGNAMSRLGPLAEIHDASPAQGGPYALFGFLGVPPQARNDEHALRQHILSQLTRLFGSQAATPLSLSIKDWAIDPFTANAQDQQPLYAHPDYGLPATLCGLWDGKLIFGGTEVAQQFGGYLEGALEAAENALRLLTKPER